MRRKELVYATAYELDPQKFGLPKHSVRSLFVGGRIESLIQFHAYNIYLGTTLK
jgi:hypothetical protein